MNCILKPEWTDPDNIDNTPPEISLENGRPFYIGRGPQTKIKNSRCSKKQVGLTANFGKKTVQIEQLGPNHSALNGKIIGMGLKEVGKDGDSLEILQGELVYKICFSGGDEGEAVEPPKKIPKMFQPKTSAADSFKKDELLLKGTWEVKGNNDVVIMEFGEQLKEYKPYVASFDIDGTIITTKSGKVFATGPEDWKFLYPQTPDCLRKFFEEHQDYKFVIFTNQAGTKDAKLLQQMQTKLENVCRKIGIPALVFVAPNRNKFRKPVPGSWDLFVSEYNGGIVPDLVKSFYCGDAAGRKGDHAISDKLFALNIGITFKVPEEFFLNSKKQQETSMPVFDPKKYLALSPTNDHVTFPGRQEMIIMVGFPGSGKSSFVKDKILPKDYAHVNRDTLKTQNKCLSVAENALQNGQSVVVDNTNPEAKDRAEYVKLAKKCGVPVRCFKMSVDHGHALHNNKFRQLTNSTGNSVPPVVYNTFKSRYQEPAKEEGYSDIVSINFVPDFTACTGLERENRAKLYGSYLLEK